MGDLQRSLLGRLTALLVVAALTLLPASGRADEAPLPAGVPVRIVIPAIGIDTAVIALDLMEDLTMPVPHRADLVAWYTYSALAGAPGNAVFAGHRDWQRQRGAFWDLRWVGEGDEIRLQDADGRWYLFEVEWSRSFDRGEAPLLDILGRVDGWALTLITCTGDFDGERYLSRFIVQAELL